METLLIAAVIFLIWLENGANRARRADRRNRR